MANFNKDMVKLAKANTFFQKEVYLDKNVQIVLMSLKPGEDIGEETHRADQTTYFVEGSGSAVLDGKSNKVAANHMIVIPQGTRHNIINKGDTPLKLFSVYAPPAEDPGVKHKTKSDAEEANKGVIAKTVETVAKTLSRAKAAASGSRAKPAASGKPAGKRKA